MDRIYSDDALDSSAAEICPVCGQTKDRRDHSAQVFYTRRLNKILVLTLLASIVAILCLATITFGFWERAQDRQRNTLLNCHTLWKQGGAPNPMCSDYEGIFKALDNEYRNGAKR
jgi:hypothetical protein